MPSSDKDRWLTKHQAKRREQAKRTKKFSEDISSIAKSLDGIDLSLAKIASFVSMSNTVEVQEKPREYQPQFAQEWHLRENQVHRNTDDCGCTPQERQENKSELSVASSSTNECCKNNKRRANCCDCPCSRGCCD